MGVIRKLTKDEIAKVAAGEVIENPASVIKELIENSIDANSTNIKIYIENNGNTLIEVIDDGTGMDKEDLLACVQSHTTSKLKDSTEIEHVRTLGFRGEALHSIAAVSELGIESKTKNNLAGYMIKVKENKMIEKKMIGMPTGTRVCVKDLFFNLPARKAHINDSKNELQKIIQIVTAIAIQYNIVEFKLYHDRELVLQLAKTADKHIRIEQILGHKLIQYMLTFDKNFPNEHVHLHGYISNPQGATSRISHQHIYVNGRYIKNNKIKSTIKSAFRTLIDVRYNPNFILYIEVPYEFVDVNIHPKKESVLLYKENIILNCIYKTIQNTLDINNLTYTYNSKSSYSKKANKNLLNVLKDSSDVWNIKTAQNTKNNEILQVNDLYLIVENENGIVIFDQHAAHERILYEEYLAVYKKHKQKLIRVNQEVTIPISLQETLIANIKKLKDAGIWVQHIKHSNGNRFKILKIDMIFKNTDIVLLLHDILGGIETIRGDVADFSFKTISYLACRSAIKSGEYLTYEERKNLLDKLAETKTNYTCPHGRPVCITISAAELKTMFKR